PGMTPLPDRRTFVKATLGCLAGISTKAFGQITGSGIANTKLADNLFLLTGAGANVVAMTGAAGVVMVDGGLNEKSAALLAAVAGLPGGGRVRTLFNTHWHPEHTGSNAALGRDGATIIAHENTRLWMTTDITRPWENRTFPPFPKEGRPDKTFYTTGSLN